MSSGEYRLRFNERFLLDAIGHYRRQLWWHGQYGALRWVLAACLGALIAVAFYGRAFTVAIVLGGVLGMLLGVMLLGDPIDAWIAKRRLRKSPSYNNDLVYRISPSGLHITGNNEDTHLKWTAYSKARRFPDGLLLFQGPHFFNWIPDSAASDPAVIEELKSLARNAINDYRDV